MKKVSVLCVCGSGVVSSSMVSVRLKEMLAEKGFDAEMKEASPVSMETEIQGNKFDVIACISPVYEDYGIPKVNAIGLMTGINAEEVVDECIKVFNKE